MHCLAVADALAEWDLGLLWLVILLLAPCRLPHWFGWGGGRGGGAWLLILLPLFPGLCGRGEGERVGGVETIRQWQISGRLRLGSLSRGRVRLALALRLRGIVT
jgi:hypothetical protein